MAESDRDAAVKPANRAGVLKTGAFFRRGRFGLAPLALLALVGTAAPVMADQPDQSSCPSTGGAGDDQTEQKKAFLDDPFGAIHQSLQELQKFGVTLSLQEDSEAWANLTGGGRRGTAYVGLTTGKLDVDLCKLMGWSGGRFLVSGYDIHGHGPSRSLLGNQQLVSDLEAAPSIKLYDLWLDQTVLDGKLSVRVGQEGANDEFMITAYGGLYFNSSFGFPAMTAAVLPSGGPNYPLATPFARVQLKPDDKLTLLGAIYNGDPAPRGPGDPQVRDRNGTAFRLNDHAIGWGELQYAAPDPNASDKLPTTYKIGTWYATNHFADQRFDNAGGLLASPTSTGVARDHSGDWGVYGAVDQLVWVNPDAKERGIGVFALVMGGPSDRNLSNFSAEAGVNWIGPFDCRPGDTVGLGFSYLGISPAARQFSSDRVGFGQLTSRYASNETVLEATYQAPITNWLTLQPDLQYVINPSAGIPNNFGATPQSNALLIGLRATIRL